MAKNIVFCADGTWNGSDPDEDDDGVLDATNVLRLFGRLAGKDSIESLRKQDEQERVLIADGSVRQVAKYIHGVGDSGNPIKRFFGGAFGSGLVKRIVRGYTFISRNYEPGDRIFLVGFSRGAYTARALGGMIASVGLLDRNAMMSDGQHDAEKAYRMGTRMWEKYRENAGMRSPLLSRLMEWGAKSVDPGQTVEVDKIAAIAVWDTVGSLGIPVFEDKDNKPLDIYRFADRKLSPKVEKAFHAVAIDEERKHFQPTLWEPQDERIRQTWFAGAHSDVGGGYPDPCLSDISLSWMARHLEKEGVAFDRLDDIKKVENYIACHQPWTEGIFAKMEHMERSHPDNARFHPSVAWLLDNFPDKYQPRSLQRFRDGDGGPLKPDHIDES